jgi:glycosyltransferase involved in cell wall biosynthesis
MKIAVDAAVLEMPLTGVGKTTLLLYEHCLKLRPDLEIVFVHRKPLQCTLLPEIQTLQSARIVPSKFWRATVLPRLLAKVKPDWCHFPWNGNVVETPGAKVAMTLHDILPLAIPNYFASEQDRDDYQSRTQADIDRSDLLVTVSQYSAAEITKSFRTKDSPLVLHHGPTFDATSAVDSHAGGFFLYVGGYDPRKGLPELLSVFTELRRNAKLNGRLVLTGSKHYFSPVFQRQVEDAIAAGYAEERGYVSDEELKTLLSSAMALVYPSRFEGFGLPPLEAMAAGCPVITTHGTSIPEICGDAVCYIDPLNVQEFAAGLIALEHDPELRQRLSAAGRKRAAQFTWQNAATQFLAALTESVHH